VSANPVTALEEGFELGADKEVEDARHSHREADGRSVPGRGSMGAPVSAPRRPRVGLALGSGAARGWAHVGAIRGLEQAGIRPDLVCGTSVGSLVAAAYAAGELDRFEQWLLGMRLKDVVGLMDVSLGGGLLKGERLVEFFRRNFVDQPIEALGMPFAAVATALRTGAEVWLRDGSTVEAVRASIALPGLFAPALRDGITLVDGGLVNPVPVSLARAMGADIVIAVDLSADRLGHRLPANARPNPPDGVVAEWMRKLQESLGGLLPARSSDEYRPPSMYDVLFSSLDIMQDRIARSRMAGEPPDFIVSPRLAHLHLLDFHRAREAIDEGRRAVEEILHNLRALGDPPS
jgi:NTE family protein